MSEALGRLLLAVQAGDAAHEERALALLVGTRSEVAREAATLALRMLKLGFKIGALLGDNGNSNREDEALRIALEAFVGEHRPSHGRSLTLVGSAER
jgi:hypothetical protein